MITPMNSAITPKSYQVPAYDRKALLHFPTPSGPTLLATLLAALLLLPAMQSSGQIAATLTGTVTDTTGAPLADVSVFIASSTMGTVTSSDGTYILPGVPLGTLRLVASSIGYESQNVDMFVREAAVIEHNFVLQQTIYELGEITVSADNKRWQRQLERFTRIFIGESPNAAETTILNSEVLDFSGRGGEFRAQASEPLIIENKALGYRITYYLNEFVAEPTSWRWDGEPLYESLRPESPEEAARWNAKRDSTFYGSFRHFLLAAINDKVEEHGFKIYSSGQRSRFSSGSIIPGGTRMALQASDILRPGKAADERILDFEGMLEIVYTREVESAAYLRHEKLRRRPKFQTSPIKLDRGPTIVDLKGDTLDPYGVTFYGGYFAYERIADDVPKEYRPGLHD